MQQCECEQIDRSLHRRTIHSDENYRKLSEGRADGRTNGLAIADAGVDRRRTYSTWLVSTARHPITGRPLQLNELNLG